VEDERRDTKRGNRMTATSRGMNNASGKESAGFSGDERTTEEYMEETERRERGRTKGLEGPSAFR